MPKVGLWERVEGEGERRETRLAMYLSTHERLTGENLQVCAMVEI